MNNDFSSIRLEITSKCNINCKYCHNADYANKNDDMSNDEIKQMMLSLKKEYPINKVLLTGGEPLLNSDIVDLVKFISDLGIKVDMVTNGKLLNEQLVQELVNAGLKRIRISIDGFEEHKAYRKGSDPYALWALCKYIKENTNLNLVVHTVSSPHNVATLEKIYDKIVEIGVDRWRVFDIGYSGSAAKNLNLFAFTGYYEEFMDAVARIIKKYVQQNMTDKLDIEINGVFKTNLLGNVYDYFYEIDNEKMRNDLLDRSPCDYIYHQMTIRSNGKSTLCQYFHDTIFDYREHSFDATTARSHPHQTVEGTMKLSSVKHCPNCKYILICNSGCRSKAEFITGNIVNPDPVACVIMPLFFEKIVPILDDKTKKGFRKLLIGDTEPLYSASDLYEFIQQKVEE